MHPGKSQEAAPPKTGGKAVKIFGICAVKISKLRVVLASIRLHDRK